MDRTNQATHALSTQSRAFPVILLLFVGSGFSALVYEIVWFQMLQLVIGASTISLGILLATFMGGMCLGSLGFSRVVSNKYHPLRVYALLELAIGAIGFCLLFVLPNIGGVYSAWVTHGFLALVIRCIFSAVCLIIPTVLMGATLPAIARWVESTPRGVSRLGFFYGANIAGAVFGCLAAGFYLLRLHDVNVATYVAVAANVLVASVAYLVAGFLPYHSSELSADKNGTDTSQADTKPGVSVYLVIGISGFCALGSEVIWTRLLSLLLGGTVYTFSIILAVFLISLGIGASIGSMVASSKVNARLALGICQMLLCGAIAWTGFIITRSLPYWPIDTEMASNPWISFQVDLARCLWAMLPPAVLWGASFPLALAAAVRPGQDPGRLVGGIYAANTVGAIVGSLAFALIMISWMGTQFAHRTLIIGSAFGACLMIAPLLWRRTEQPGFAWDALVGSVGFVAALGAVGTLAWSQPNSPPGLVGYGRLLPYYYYRDDLPEFLYWAEGLNASIAVSKESDGIRNFHVSGKVVASSDPVDMKLQRMLCHFPSLFHPEPKSVLIVGCGAGVTAGSFVVHPSIERIVICEIEPLIPPAAGEYFGKENYSVMKDPRVEVIIDDARHYILTTDEKFDIITSDPIHPWVKGAAALYSKEYFDLCKKRLNPGGLVTQWVPLYESNLEAVKSQIGTFMDAFPHGTIWNNDDSGEGYDIVLLGSVEPTKIDIRDLSDRIRRADHAEVLASLREVQLGSALQLVTTFAGQGPDLDEWLSDVQLNQDSNMRLQYLAGMGLNLFAGDSILQSFLVYRKYPANLFVVDPQGESLLRQIFEPSDN